MPSKEGYHNPVMPLDRPAAKEAPFAYATRQQPAKGNPGTGRCAAKGSSCAGGAMNPGGKRRPRVEKGPA